MNSTDFVTIKWEAYQKAFKEVSRAYAPQISLLDNEIQMQKFDRQSGLKFVKTASREGRGSEIIFKIVDSEQFKKSILA